MPVTRESIQVKKGPVESIGVDSALSEFKSRVYRSFAEVYLQIARPETAMRHNDGIAREGTYVIGKLVKNPDIEVALRATFTDLLFFGYSQGLTINLQSDGGDVYSKLLRTEVIRRLIPPLRRSQPSKIDEFPIGAHTYGASIFLTGALDSPRVQLEIKDQGLNAVAKEIFDAIKARLETRGPSTSRS